MDTQQIGELELLGEDGFRFAFAVTEQAGSAAVYFELDPGAVLPSHTDSAEELLLVLAGSIEATVGDETGSLERGELAVVPANVPHGARNAGGETARVIGFFAGGTIVSEFSEPIFPGGPRWVVNGRPYAPLEVPTTLPA